MVAVDGGILTIARHGQEAHQMTQIQHDDRDLISIMDPLDELFSHLSEMNASAHKGEE